MTHMFLLLIAFVTTSLSDSDQPSLKRSQPNFFYKGKFFHFFPLDDQVHVLEEGMIPYSTKIRNVLFPKPQGNITDIYVAIKDRLIVAVTTDNKKWIYDRLKLRRVEPITNAGELNFTTYTYS